MGREKNNTGISVGSSSILVIFVVLCLTTFATLSLVSAKADYKLTQKTAQATAEYYAADAKAEEYLQKLHKALQGTGADGWFAQLQLVDIKLTYEVAGGSLVLRYDVPINDQKKLHVELGTELDIAGKPTGPLQRLRWQVQPIQQWQGEEQVNVAGISNLPIF
ncbi:hypothetical protein [Hydrogenoanaerobacterium sp.]|uniref:hypothetical protein n=1 Tax=Hydrogenoanaerobacterium sp. TaxID=2953763 RepID=UPI00289ADA71|nr:hypothetical protein [Hydrogenoanaerobacterium sp.]